MPVDPVIYRGPNWPLLAIDECVETGVWLNFWPTSSITNAEPSPSLPEAPVVPFSSSILSGLNNELGIFVFAWVISPVGIEVVPRNVQEKIVYRWRQVSGLDAAKFAWTYSDNPY